MNDINCPNIVELLKKDFGGLWHCFDRGESVEIVTPYLYPNNSFVSVFITKRKDRIIVSDGGDLTEYMETAESEEDFQKTAIFRFLSNYKVQAHIHANTTYFFKECLDMKLLSSATFDLCNFIVASSSSIYLSETIEEEVGERLTFRREADNYIRHVVPDRHIDFNHALPEIEEATFSAVISSNSRIWLVHYLTGSDIGYFTRSVSNAIVNAQFARESKINPFIVSIIPLVNNQASGYKPDKLRQRFEKLKEITKSDPVNWTEKSILGERLAA